ncbi:hypothetical protein H5410_056033 [Solanum commersonii]|uniref:Uncharacterized protein n=1 Tax=Solanum commersonii TaxID=4109 RepID=A0A9J5WJ62_SOLCO|nr:hypothetical protein H5410_056033 [Solanum commersonii]
MEKLCEVLPSTNTNILNFKTFTELPTQAKQILILDKQHMKNLKTKEIKQANTDAYYQTQVTKEMKNESQLKGIQQQVDVD